MSNKTTLQDIADALDITKVTVSRALKQQGGVSEELRKRIEETATRMGYSRSSLHDKPKTHRFAFLTPTRFFLKTEHFYKDIYYLLHRLCDQKDHRVSLHVIDPQQEASGTLPKELRDASLSGIFIGGELSPQCLSAVSEIKLPCVVIDHISTIPGFSHITVDNYFLAYKAARYLIERGHRQIGFVGQKAVSSNVADRMMGIQKALGEIGENLREEWIIENHDPVSGFYTLDFDLPRELPGAFICHCDRAAYFLMEKLKSRGIKIPEDISIVGFDDTEIAQQTCPPLTTMKIDRQAFAEKGVCLMENLLEGGKSAERIYVETELIERKSVLTLKDPA